MKQFLRLWGSYGPKRTQPEYLLCLQSLLKVQYILTGYVAPMLRKSTCTSTLPVLYQYFTSTLPVLETRSSFPRPLFSLCSNFSRAVCGRLARWENAGRSKAGEGMPNLRKTQPVLCSSPPSLTLPSGPIPMCPAYTSVKRPKSDTLAKGKRLNSGRKAYTGGYGWATVRHWFGYRNTLVRRLLGRASAFSRSIAEGLSKASRTGVEALSKDCRTSLEQQSNNGRRNIEESCVCTHAKAPARGGLGLALVLVVLLFVALGKQGLAQENFSVSGKVISAASGVAIEGATVTNKRTRIHAVTDEIGNYRIIARPDDVLTYSFVGYISAEEKINGRQQITVALDSADNMLDEVEVISTGYQSIPKERATGSFVFVDSALLNRAISTDIISRLKGVVPSLLFDERAGGDPKLSIRGRSTIYANADPLIVVDNFPYEGDIRNINPNDVESVSILRDAAAASIWGVRAGNGVIVITTRKGRLNQPIQVGFNGNVTVSAKPDQFYERRIAPSDFIDIEKELFEQGYYANDLANTTTFPVISPAVEIMADASLSEAQRQQQLDLLRGTDIRNDIGKHFYRTGVKQQYALNLRGGSDRHRYYYAANLNHDQKSVRSDSYRRINLTARNQFSFFDRLHVQTGLELNNSLTTTDNTLYWLRTAFPYQRLADDDGNAWPMARDFRASFAARAEKEGRLNWQYFPLQEPGNHHNRTGLHHYRANVSGKYGLWNGLELSVYYQYEQQVTERNDLFHPESYLVRDLVNRFTQITPEGGTEYPVPLGSILDRTAGNLRSHNGRAQLGYQRNWRDLHEVTALAGFEVRESDYRSHSNRYYGYDEHTGTAIPIDLGNLYPRYPVGGWARITAAESINGTLNRFRSFYANGAYTYEKRYTFSGSARMDQTNLFGVRANQRSIPLWSGGIKWDVNREAFYALDWLPRLSLRYSFGYNGNFDETAAAYIVAAYFTNRFSRREARLGNLPNPDLKGERTAVSNVGVDFASRSARITGRFDWYVRRGRGLIGDAPFDATTGSNTFRGNVADMNGYGWDAELNTVNIQSESFAWRSDLFWSFTADKVVDYHAVATPYYFSDASLSGYHFEINPVSGRPLFGIYSLPWAGLDPQTGDPQGYVDGQVSKDYPVLNNIPAMDSLYYHGRAQPSSLGSFRNTIRWRRWTLSANISWKLGYYFRRQPASLNLNGSPNTFTSDYALRWKQPGDEQHTQIPSLVYPQNTSRNTFYQRSSALVEKGDHIRLQDVQLSFDFRRAQVYAYMNNLGILWRANDNGIDPDFNSNPALGNTVLPTPRTVALGVRVNIQ